MTHAVDVSAYLNHAAAASDGGGSKKGKGGGKFDESKVKRDGDGQFARKQGKKDLTWAEANKLDLEWNAKFESFVDELELKVAKRGKTLLDSIARKNGFESGAALATAKDRVKAEKTAMEYISEAKKIATDMLKSDSRSVSPSGRQKIEVYEPPEGGADFRIVGTVANDTNPTPPSLPKRRRGPMFNPTADISAGKVTDELKQSEDSTALTHAERTIQDIMNEMSEDEKDFQALLVGAGIDDEDISDPAIAARYDALSDERKYLIHFFVGNVIADYAVEHSDTDDGELMHFGVKGMRWGIRKSEPGQSGKLSKMVTANDREVARARVKAGNTNLGTAHVAALKSTGHRAINFVLGDKTYWKRTAIVAGVAGTVAGAAFLAPAVLPAGVLASVGASVVGTTGFGGAVTYSSAYLASVGASTVTGVGLAAAQTISTVGGTVNSVTNAYRAVGGNAAINRSYAKLGREVCNRQQLGSTRVQKMLNRVGSIPKKRLKQSEDLAAGVFLSHMMEAIEAFEADDQLMHYGIKGMKWGIRRSDVQLALINRKQAKLDTAQVKLNAKAQAAGLKKVTVDQDGNVVSKAKGSSSKPDDPEDFSEDALKLVQTSMKPANQLSTKEIQDALLRANITKQYDQLVNPNSDPNAELRRKVEQLNLQKQYSTLVREMTPLTAKQKFAKNVTALVKGSAKSYTEYVKMDKATGGALSDAFGEAFRAKGNQTAGKRRGPGRVLRPPSTTAAMKKAAEKAAKKAAKNP